MPSSALQDFFSGKNMICGMTLTLLLLYELVYRFFQFIYSLRLIIPHGVDYAVFDMLNHYNLAGAGDGRANRGKLYQDFTAIPVILHHTPDRLQVPNGA
jgi:hypothetical protein